MSTGGSEFSLQLYDALEINYERAYGQCPPKIAAVKKAISLIPAHARVLDVGCGSGAPVVELLANAGLEVFACDISPKMIEHTRRRFTGTFQVADMLDYEPEGKFAAIFILFSHLSLTYKSFYAVSHKFANALEPGGNLVIGQVPSDKKDVEEAAYDPTGSYVDDYNVPFMGEDFPTLMMTARAQREFLSSMGLTVVYETIDLFQPDHPNCKPEEQQYLIAKRPEEMKSELALPFPLPRAG